jgi:PIN domain nuclease of toxin-antitoxin system
VQILLDTHSLIWFLDGDDALSRRARLLIEDRENDTLVSIASLWEIAVKVGIGKLNLRAAYGELFPRLLEENAIDVLGASVRHFSRLTELPLHHRDPFDRLIVAQALEEGFVVVGRDSRFDAYGVERAW